MAASAQKRLNLRVVVADSNPQHWVVTNLRSSFKMAAAARHAVLMISNMMLTRLAPAVRTRSLDLKSTNRKSKSKLLSLISRWWRRGSAAASPCQRTRPRSPNRSSGLGCAASPAAERRRTAAWTLTTQSCPATTTAGPNSETPPTDEWWTAGRGHPSPAHTQLLPGINSRTWKLNRI